MVVEEKRKKDAVGGSVEQLPNTCQVENKTIGDLAAVITIMITMMHSPTEVQMIQGK